MSISNKYYDVGSYSRKISSKSPDTQLWFDRGLIWCYSFHFEEACKCFERAVEHDSSSAISHWGVAFASGPNYNKPWSGFDAKDKSYSLNKWNDACKAALKHLDSASPWERALVKAIQHRCPAELVEDFDPVNKAYADAMREVYRQYKSDIDMVNLFADALMNYAPRKMYHEHSGKPIESSPVYEVKEVIEKGLQLPGGENHVGLNHMYIHLMEMSETPEAALVAANNLRYLVPDGGHVSHMPSHIYVLVGDYLRAMDSNLQATHADDKYFAREGGKNFYTVYRLHDYHSLIYAATLAGNSRAALEAVDRMEATISEDILRVESPPMANMMEAYLSVRVHVLIRFGMWDKLLDLPIPEDKELYCCTVAITHYGKAIAHASMGNVSLAEEQRERYLEAAKRVPPTRLSFPNRYIDILKVATAMLDGELEYRKSNYDLAFEKLREAIACDDALLYTEPWGWMVPTRHAYGALSLEQGHVEQAAKVYAQDLGLNDELVRVHQHPNNVWALKGYHECLVKLGRLDEANIIKKQLTIGAATADVPIESSCFCRIGKCDKCT